MIESGIVTKDVEQFVCINLKVSADIALDIEEALAKLISSDVIAMLPKEGQDSLSGLQEAIQASLVKYRDEFDEHEQYTGDIK